MELKLLSSCPGKRFENEPRLTADGRGGWQLSQINTDRWVSGYNGYYLVYCLAVLATDASEDDFVERTRLSAFSNGDPVGTDELKWKAPNQMWLMMDGDAIFEWAQAIDLFPTCDGLITISIDVKLHSSTEWVRVNGSAFARIRNVGEMPQDNWRWTNPWLHPIIRLIPKRFRRSKTDW
jgi:hypothetical protein